MGFENYSSTVLRGMENEKGSEKKRPSGSIWGCSKQSPNCSFPKAVDQELQTFHMSRNLDFRLDGTLEELGNHEPSCEEDRAKFRQDAESLVSHAEEDLSICFDLQTTGVEMQRSTTN